jgi:ATP-dependent Clp protease ATP-binding subunit ClpA
MMKRVTEQLKAKDLEIELTDAAKTLLAEQGYDPALGARPLRRTIQRLVEDPLSEKLLWKEFRAGRRSSWTRATARWCSRVPACRRTSRPSSSPPIVGGLSG